MSTRLPKHVKKYFKSGGATKWGDTQGVKPLGEMGQYILNCVYKQGGIALDVGAGKGSLGYNSNLSLLELKKFRRKYVGYARAS